MKRRLNRCALWTDTHCVQMRIAKRYRLAVVRRLVRRHVRRHVRRRRKRLSQHIFDNSHGDGSEKDESDHHREPTAQKKACEGDGVGPVARRRFFCGRGGRGSLLLFFHDGLGGRFFGHKTISQNGTVGWRADAHIDRQAAVWNRQARRLFLQCRGLQGDIVARACEVRTISCDRRGALQCGCSQIVA